MGRLVTAPTHALLRTHRGRPDTGTRQQLRMDSRMNVQPTLHVELVPLADLPPEPMLWCPTCLGRHIVALGSADAVLREVAA